MPNKGTVYVVDDDPGALRSLSWLIRQADYNVHAFSSGNEFLASLQGGEDGCVVLDFRMPQTDGLTVQRRLSERGLKLPVIFITAYGDLQACRQAFRAGAFDFLEKPVDDQVLLAHLEKAMVFGSQQKPPQTVQALSPRVDCLTPREKEVLELLLQGKSLKSIAALNSVSVQTIWRHRMSIFNKLGVENEVELIRATMKWSNEHP